MTKYIITSYNSNNDMFGGKLCDDYDKPPHIIGHVKRIIAIGDIHGDFTLLIKCLKLANLINDNGEWIGKDTIVVQVGDQIDNCREINNCINHKDDNPEDVKILMYMTNLHLQAKKYNGAVYSLIGNHELMNIEGDMRYVSYKNILAFSNNNNFAEGLENRKKYFMRGSKMAKLLGCTRNSGIIIGELLFVHAGMLPKLAKNYDIKNINKLIRRWVLGKDVSKYSSILTKLKDDLELSPFWTRLFGDLDSNLDDNQSDCEKLNKTLDLYKLKGMVIGHTPQFYPHNLGINNTCGEKLWRIDFGGSNGFNNYDKGKYQNSRKPQVLEILDDMTNKHNLKFNVLI
jgi:hypothetical protein